VTAEQWCIAVAMCLFYAGFFFAFGWKLHERFLCYRARLMLEDVLRRAEDCARQLERDSNPQFNQQSPEIHQ
jgi:hypothetical protein